MQRRERSPRIRNKGILMIGMLILVSQLFFKVLVKADDRREEAPPYKYYTSVQIHPGDTLWDIASEYCDNSEQIQEYMRELRHINRLKSDAIHAGRYLTVVYYSEEYK